MSAASDRPRRVLVLGSTGSVGVNALAVIDHLHRSGQAGLRVVGLAAGGNARLLFEQARRCGAKAVALSTPTRDTPPPGVTVLQGEDAAVRLVETVEADVVVSAIVGIAGLRPTLAAIEHGRDIALANKETLVAAGGLVMPRVAARGVRLLPVDSEHSAVFQCLPTLAGSPCKPDVSRVARVVLTASGGPFREADPESVFDATPERALNHPTWDMGPKITIDSATMMNKTLEIIEAHHLFGLPGEKITALIHPQSVVHGMVEFTDHSVLTQMGPPDMRAPIQFALTCPDRPAGCARQIDWTRLSRLDFTPPDARRFPAIPLAYRVIGAGGTAGAILNAANEQAVAAFLEHRIRFGRIVQLVAAALDALPSGPVADLDAVLAADAAARAFVAEQIEAPAPATR